MLPNSTHKLSSSTYKGEGKKRLLATTILFMGMFLLGLGGAADVNAHNVTYSAGPGGSLTGTVFQTPDTGEDCTTVTAVPDSNYHFVNWSIISGAANGAFSPLDQPALDITNVQGDIDVTANFAIDQYTVTVNSPGAGSGGHTDKDGANVVNHGGSITITPSPDASHDFTGWTGDHVGNENPLTISNVTTDMVIDANFTIKQYTVTVNSPGAGSGGHTDKDGANVVNHGGSITITPSPDASHDFAGWTGDHVGNENPLTISNVTTDMVIDANFTIKQYTVNVSSTVGGSTDQDGTHTVNHGGTLIINATAVVGYQAADPLWTGVPALQQNDNPIAVTVVSDMNITANFDKTPYTLTISIASGNGSVAPPTGTTYFYDDGLVVSATPNPDWVFTGWTGDTGHLEDPNAATTNLINPLNADTNIQANFTTEAALTVTKTGNGTVTSDDGNINCGGLCTHDYTYPPATTVILSQSPDVGWEFNRWVYNGMPYFSTTFGAFMQEDDIDVTAIFSKTDYILTISVGSGNGSVSPPTGNTYVYDEGLEVTATPDAGWEFVNWTGDTGNLIDANSSTTNLINPLYGNTSIQANFQKITYTLTISESPAGSATVSPATGTTYVYDDGLVVSATPNPGWEFVSWTGDTGNLDDPSSATTSLKIPLYGDTNIQADFVLIEYTLTTNVAGAFGTGTVTKAPDQPTYHYGDVVTLTANPGIGEQFVNWTGPSAGDLVPDVNTASVTITIDEYETVTANFDYIEYTLTVNTAGAFGTGTVTRSPDNPTYHYGDVVTLTAVPGTGEQFDQWSGDLTSNTNPDSITIDDNKTVTAHFDYIEYMLAITVIGSGSGTVAKSPDQPTYHYGDVVQLTANPDPLPGGGSIFKGWSGDLTGSANPDSITIHAGTNAVTAEFAQTWVITATAGANGTISPSGSVQVEEGLDLTFIFDPNTCYEVDNVIVDGSSIGGEIRDYTFTNITADHTIDVQFYHYDCTITATAEHGGTITPSGAVTVPCGSNQSFTISAGMGNEIAEVLIDGVDLGIGSGITTYNYNWTNVKKDDDDTSPCVHYIVAKFTRPALSCMDISDVPLNAMSRSAPANIMFVLDDSGSMDWEFMTDENNGLFSGKCYVFNNPGDNIYTGYTNGGILSGAERLRWKSQWSGYNRMYYDPNVDYSPWPTRSDADPDFPQSHPMHAGNALDLSGIYESLDDGIVIDNQDGAPTFTTPTGTWSESGASPEYNGSSYYSNDAGATATWTPSLPTAGNYEVWIYWTSSSGWDRDASAEYTIHDTIGDHVFVRDQRVNYGQWNLMGTFSFAAGSSGYVTLTRGSGGATSADAVKFVSTSGGGSISIRNAHYYVWSATESKPYLVIIDGGSIEYYEVNDDGDDLVETGELTLTASPPADVVTGRSYVEERQNFANWYSFYRKRELTATAAIANVISNMQGVNIGFKSINELLNQPVLKIKVGTVDETNTLLNSLYALVLSAQGTPLRTGLRSVGRYFHQDDGLTGGIGASPYASVAEGGECQQSFAIVMTDGYYNGGSPGVGNRDIDDPAGDPDNPFDGPPYEDAFSDTLADVAMYYYENDLSTTLGPEVPENPWDDNPQQHLVTYGVSFGVTGTLDPSAYDFINTFPTWPNPTFGDQQKIDDLWHASVNGRGFFLSASNPNELVNSLLDIMQNIEEREGSASSVSVNGDELYTQLSGGGDILMFQSSYDTENWTGDVKAYQVCTELTGNCAGKEIGDIIKSPYVWSANEELGGLNWNTGRKIVTYNGTDEGKTFRWGDLTTDQQTALNNDSTLLDYLRGDTTNEAANGGTFRNRFAKLGDMVHSSPTFENGVLYAGGNDGMLHAFTAADDEPYAGAVGGQELFAYVPNLVFDNLNQLADPNYTHKYFVDLTPSVKAGVDISGVSTTVLVGGLGKGGRGYYALNVTDPTSWTSEGAIDDKVMWEYPKAGVTDDDMGYSFSKPAIVACNDPNVGWIVIFGNGYNSQNGHAVLYILNPGTGVIIRKIDTGVDGCNGLSTAVPIDVDYDNKVDYVYAGDLRGNVWKFDLTDSDYTNWEVAFYDGEEKPLFQAQGPGGTTQPITAKPDVMYHPTEHGYMVLFGTGQYLGESDISDTTAQSFYGIWDYGDDEDDSEYLGYFRRGYGQELSNQPSTVSLLAQQIIPSESPDPNAPDFWTVTINEGQSDEYDLLLRITTDHDIVWETVSDMNNTPFTDPLDDLSDSVDNHAGWYFDLPLSGERGTVDMMIRGGVIIAISFIPEDTPCGHGGVSVVHEMDAASGARLTSPQFDINGDGVIDDDDMINIGTEENPIWVVPSGILKEGQLQPPAILIDPERGVEIKYFSSSSGNIETVYEKPPLLGISHWREFE